MPEPSRNDISAEDVESARAFLDRLVATASGVPCQVDVGSRWAFRGQADVNWPLIPKAQREPPPSTTNVQPATAISRTWRVLQESTWLTAFYERADQSGI